MIPMIQRGQGTDNDVRPAVWPSYTGIYFVRCRWCVAATTNVSAIWYLWSVTLHLVLIRPILLYTFQPNNMMKQILSLVVIGAMSSTASFAFVPASTRWVLPSRCDQTSSHFDYDYSCRVVYISTTIPQQKSLYKLYILSYRLIRCIFAHKN